MLLWISFPTYNNIFFSFLKIKICFIRNYQFLQKKKEKEIYMYIYIYIYWGDDESCMLCDDHFLFLMEQKPFKRIGGRRGGGDDMRILILLLFLFLNNLYIYSTIHMYYSTQTSVCFYFLNIFSTNIYSLDIFFYLYIPKLLVTKFSDKFIQKIPELLCPDRQSKL